MGVKTIGLRTIGIQKPKAGSGRSWSRYWMTLISAVVENAAPTNVVLTYAKKVKASDINAANFTVSGKTVQSATLDATGNILTIVFTTAFTYGDIITLVITENATPHNFTVVNNISAEAELTTFVTGLTNPLGAPQKIRLNNFIKSLKVGFNIQALSEFFDVLQLFNNETAEATLKNLVSDLFHSESGGTVYFRKYNGLTGVTNGYVQVNYSPADGINFQQTDNAFGVGINNTTTGGMVDIGVDDTNKCQLIASFSGTLSARSNDTSTTQRTIANVNSKGDWIVSRNGDGVNNLTVYKDKTIFTTNTQGTSNTGTRSSRKFNLMCQWNGTTRLYHSDREYSYFIASKHMTEAQRDIFNNALNTYKQSTLNDATFDNGKLVWTFDDGIDNNYSVALPAFQNQGIAGTFYLNAAWIGTSPTWYDASARYITWDEALQMSNAGMDMQCHSYGHPDLAFLTEENLLKALNDNKDAFVANSLPIPTELAYPSGSFNNNVKKWSSTLRTTGRALNTNYGSHVYANTDRFEIVGGYVQGVDATKMAALKAQLLQAKTNKTALVFISHGMKVSGESNVVSVTVFNEIINYAKSIGIDIITMKQLSSLMWNKELV